MNNTRPQYLCAAAVVFGASGILLRFVAYRHPRIAVALIALTFFGAFWISGYFKEWWSLRPYTAMDGTFLEGEAARERRKSYAHAKHGATIIARDICKLTPTITSRYPLCEFLHAASDDDWSRCPHPEQVKPYRVTFKDGTFQENRFCDEAAESCGEELQVADVVAIDVDAERPK